MSGVNDARSLALAYLSRNRVMTLATYGGGQVWAAALFYVNDGFDLLFLSSAHTRHGGHLQTEGKAAATIQEQYEDWTAIQGVQVEGEVSKLAGSERDVAIALYERKYSFVNSGDPELQRALAKVNWYRLAAKRFYFIDNSRGFGHRDEIDLG